MDNKNIIINKSDQEDTNIKKKRNRRNMPFATKSASECIIIPKVLQNVLLYQKVFGNMLLDKK